MYGHKLPEIFCLCFASEMTTVEINAISRAGPLLPCVLDGNEWSESSPTFGTPAIPVFRQAERLFVQDQRSDPQRGADSLQYTGSLCPTIRKVRGSFLALGFLHRCARLWRLCAIKTTVTLKGPQSGALA